MFVNKINGVSNLGFKGYQHVKNNVGEDVMRFNFPYASDKETCEVQFFKVTPTWKYNYKIDETPIASVQLKPEGVDVNLQTLTELGKDEAFAYKIVRKDKETGKVLWEGADTGVKVKDNGSGEYVFRVHQDAAWKDVYKKDENGKEVLDGSGNPIKDYGYHTADFVDSVNKYSYTLVTRNGTTPMVQGAGYLAMPDSIMPGAMYRGFNEQNTGEIYFDKDYQKKMEGVVKNFSNMYNGSIAGLQSIIPYLKQNGYKVMFSTPIANGDDVSSHSYWNKNNMQIASRMGTTENYASFMQDLFKSGMKYVYDGTFTSEGLEGIHFQYALRWANKNPQSYYWFRMSGLKNSNLGLGAVPQNKENLRHRVVNAPYNYELQSDGTYKKVVNDKYNKNKPTMFQIYDASQASDEQVKKLDTVIRNYEKLTEGSPVDINSHDDTLMSFVFQIDPEEYANRIKVINDLNKKGENIKLDSADGTIMAAQFSNFKIIKKTEGGFVTWDANTDMVKMNYHISGYDEKLLQSITDKNERYLEQQKLIRGTYEVQDMAVQAMRYWTANTRNIQTMYTAKTIGSAKTVEAIDKLIEDDKLPEEVRINNTVLNNILNARYMLKPKGILDKDSVTVKSLMELPLDTLEFAENTVGVLSTSFFSNRATKEEQIGMTRFELMKQNNPHLVEPYAKNYQKVDEIFNNELKTFAESVVKKINETSDEKLIDANGDYTEYGEYVMELVGKDIAKYAMLKSLAGDSFKTKVLPDGEITYDYDLIKENTSLEALDIHAHNPEDEAKQVTNAMLKGLRGLSDNDSTYVADAISKRISGLDTASFRLAEALVDRAGLGLDWRLDAAKDIMDQDAVRNEDEHFEDVHNELIKFWKRGVSAIKSENPHSYIVAEMTDMADMMRATYGLDSCPYNGETDIGGRFNGEPDAMIKFFNETGITSEAAYSFFYTDLLKVFSPEFEEGKWTSENHDSFKSKLELLMQTRSADYLRNLYTFMGNHDKPRMIHGLALDMRLFHSGLLHDGNDFSKESLQRQDVIRVLSGAKTESDIPIELRLNVDNNDYFLTLNPRAVALNKLLMDVVYNQMGDKLTEADKRNFANSLIDLANDNYLGSGKTEPLTRIHIKELSSLEDAFSSILAMAENHGLRLSETERKSLLESVVKNANEMDLARYRVHGGFDSKEWSPEVVSANNSISQEVLGDRSDYSSYSLYTIQLARLLKDSYASTGKNPEAANAINSAIKDFVEKYNEKEVAAHSEDIKRIADPRKANRLNGYASKDIKLVARMALDQLEYKTGKKLANKDALVDDIFFTAIEPAVAKASMIEEYFKGLFGITTMYAGDEFGMTGYDEKTKNVYLQCRNAIPRSEQQRRQYIIDSMNGALKDRSDKDLHALNDGTPYMMDVCTHSYTRDGLSKRIAEIAKLLESNPANKAELEKERRMLTRDLAKVAYLMQSSNGDMTVSVFNADGIDHGNRVNYFEKYGITNEAERKKFFEDNNIQSINPNNPYIPIQPKSDLDYIMLGAGLALPVGTVFKNANIRDKAKYVVKEINGKSAIFKEGGGKIIMDGLTAKNGVMILKKLAFRGAKNRTYYNTQYHFATRPYSQQEEAKAGQNLSVIVR